ncbi:ABC transporter substrate-binding protein [Humidisolicoccus flavus]|uniref:ABC transporter substrate-binding protein n=1 Tax=Humidisolicoccus flavus TaxID=3111414 RepID=UPI003249C12A
MATALVLTGCSNSAEPSSDSADGGTITILHKWPEGDHAAFFEKIVAEYEAANPGVNIEMTAVQDDPYKERIRVLTASNDLPDIYFAWPGIYGEQFFEAGFAADLTQELEGEWGDSFIPAAIDAYTVDGSTYAVPISMSGKYMIYNEAMFAEQGLSVPTTFDELLTTCDAFSATGLTPIAMGNNAMWPGVHYLTTLIAKHVPADVIAADFNPETATFTDPGYIAAFDDLAELADRCFTEGANGISNDSSKAEIQTGVVPMYYGESNIFSIFREENGATPDVAANWNFFAFPEITDGNGDQESLTGAPDGFIVNENSKQKELAIDFLRYFTSIDNAAMLLEMRDRPSAVIGAEASVDNVLPQLTEALTQLSEQEQFNIWLDTATEPQVGAAFLAAGQAAIGGTETSEQILESIRAASDSLK